MNGADIIFTIPTYRLRDVAQTIEYYDENFHINGHAPKIMIFDDSSIANQQKYFRNLERTKTYNHIYYVGPKEKQMFTEMLLKRVGDKKLEPVINNFFRPSYGGNRNFTLIYTLGNYLVSADDDMKPEGLMLNGSQSLNEGEVARGRMFSTSGDTEYCVKQYDILSAFMEVLGKTVRTVPKKYVQGSYLEDTAMDLETNATKGFSEENSLLLVKGKLPQDAVVKMAQTYRSGTNDIDALDFVEFFIRNDDQLDPVALNSLYVLTNFRPVITKLNWRMDCGVAGYDNRTGLPPFFPTRLRFEDYIYRLWLKKSGVAAAHVDAVQRHTKNNYMRDPLASDVLNEEIANLIKRKIKGTVTRLGDLTMDFRYDGAVDAVDTEAIISKVAGVHSRVVEAAAKAQNDDRKRALTAFASNLEKMFYSFEPDFFQQNVSRLVDDEISLIKSSLEIWESLVEICYYQKDKKAFPKTMIKNGKKGR